jgi:ABC-type sulfate/molybdate transport systems ATPase subunit
MLSRRACGKIISRHASAAHGERIKYILLLDEPLGALDPRLRLTLRGKLEALLRESDVTTLFADGAAR